jgi:RNA polymerase sigma factor (sigma-70 family)
MTDRELLARFALTGSSGVFSEIVARHADVVYSTCRRMLGEGRGAEDAAQATFLVLFRKGRRLRPGTVLSDWLHRTARNCARNLARAEARRARREREAAVVMERKKRNASWSEIGPRIDAALTSLPRAQREALVLKYLRGLSRTEVARELGCPERTAASRLRLGLEKLRARLAGGGLAISTSALGALLAQRAVQSAPAGLVASIQAMTGGAAPAAAAAQQAARAALRTMFWAKLKAPAAALVAAAALAGAGAGVFARGLSAAEPAPRPGPGAAVFGEAYPWRAHFTWRTETVRTAEGKLLPVAVNKKARAAVRFTAPAPKGWANTDFDDSHWARSKLPIDPGGDRSLAILCLRGKFKVRDPSRVKALSLSAAFRGGLVVYLNGREVHRAHMPTDELSAETMAEDYPKDAYVKPDGLVLRRGFGDPRKYPHLFKKRTRRAGNVTVPVSGLRKGLNIVALELRRAPTNEVLHTGKVGRGGRHYCMWSMLAAESVSLSASPAGTVNAGARKPGGLEVWTQSPVAKVFPFDRGDPAEDLRPVRLVGARGGVFSGQVVLSSAAPIRGLKVGAGELALAGNGARIPASALTVRYARLDGGGDLYRGKRRVPWFDGLEEEPPAEVSPDPKSGRAVQPIWLSVRVPRATRAGLHSGEVKISASGAGTFSVPFEIKVHGWTLPEPGKFVADPGLVQSPRTLAIKYGVKPWSPEHWKLVDASLKFLGEAGTKAVYIPVIAKTNLGNEHSWVRWLKKADGTYEYDFAIVEQYLDLVTKRLGKVPVVCIYAWEINLGSKMFYSKKGIDPKNIKGATVSVLDPKSGTLTCLQAPRPGTPESKAFWKPVFAGLRELLKKRGLEKSMMVGLAGDMRPNKEIVGDLQAAAPEAHWVLCTHGGGTHLHGQPVGYFASVWGGGSVGVPPKRKYGWKNPVRFTTFPRSGSGGIGKISPLYSLAAHRQGLEGHMVSGGYGWMRVGADFWPVVKDKRGRRQVPLVDLYVGWGGLAMTDSNTLHVLAPGRKGPVATARFEMIREGSQECEARVFIEKALTDPARKARLGAALAERCQRVLDERTYALAEVRRGRSLARALWYAGVQPERTEGLFAAAAEVAAKLGAK